MTKIRVFVFMSTLLIVGIVGIFASYYARGYRLNFKALTTKGVIQFQPNGILVIKSEPDSASVYINGDLKSATNTTLSLPPGNYDVEVKKDGYFSWKQRLNIEKEVVTTANVSLFRSAPSLSPITFSGAQNPVTSSDGTKIAFTIPFSKDQDITKLGLWTMDVYSLPLGFSNEPKRITDGDLTNATYVFSPEGRQILLTTSNGVFLLDSGSFTPQTQMVNVAARKEAIIAQWKLEKKAKDESLVRGLPSDFSDILIRKTSVYVFSPDDNMILYTSSASGTLAENLVPQLPGASTQQQERNIVAGRTYVYDTKEDRNFLISDMPLILTNPEAVAPNTPTTTSTKKVQPTQVAPLPAIRWLTTSKHLLFAESGKVTVMDYDGTNRQVVYSGAYDSPFAFPYANATKLLILTNLGATTSVSNLYTLTVK